MNDIAPVQETPAAPEGSNVNQGEHVVIARNAAEMQAAQGSLVEWAAVKIHEERSLLADLETNLEIFKKRKWSTASTSRHVDAARRRVEFYEKALAALRAGYCIVPEMPCDIFAVRTTKKRPMRNFVSSEHYKPTPNSQETNAPPIGDGQYVSPDTVNKVQTFGIDTTQGRNKTMATAIAVAYKDVVFPFALARCEIAEDAAKAAALLIFDELAIVPEGSISQARPVALKKPDPMVLGRIVLRNGPKYQWKRINFLITWFVDTRTL